MNMVRLVSCILMALGAAIALVKGLWITAIVFALAFVLVADVWAEWWVDGKAVRMANATLRHALYRANKRATEAERRANHLEAELESVRSAIAPGFQLHESQRADQ